MILFHCCACRCTASACSLSQFFCRGRHGQESEEGKEDREGSHQKGGKEDLKEKKVIVSATEKSPPPDRNPDQSETSPKDLKCPLQPFGIAARHYKTAPVCSWLLHEGPVFRFRPGERHDLFLREGSMPHGCDALRRGSREPGPRMRTRPDDNVYRTCPSFRHRIELFVKYLIT
jgi:hypothetical protein